MTLSEKLDGYNREVNAWLEQAKRATAAIQRLERAVSTGNVREVERLRQAARTAVESAAQRGAECPPFEFDAAAYLDKDGAFIEELMQAADRVGVRLSEREGTIFSYPLLVRADPANTAIRVDKKRVISIRPETVAAMLKQAQSKEPRFNPRRFIETLFDAYELVRAQRKIDAYIDQPLTRVYEVLTLLPGLDYTLLDFTRDIYFLDTSDVNETRKGFHVSFPRSTVSREKSVKMLQFVTRDGYEQNYAAVRFTPPGKGAE